MPPEKGLQRPESQAKSALSKYVRGVFALSIDPRTSSRSAAKFDSLCSEDEQENNAIEPTQQGPPRKAFAEHAKSTEPDSFPCKFVTEKLTEGQADMTRHLMERILPTVQQMTKETAKREMKRFVAEIRDEAEEAKMLALLSRVEGLSPPSSGMMFRKRMMIDALRRALDRLELEEETDKEWEVLNNH
ncbi:hypothetical protein DL769_008976 [Monosporascus sp. CRB-8-3]|nr:hypothetical protein DL769_008976 [Monosporascus sp. CRB-8-3]